MTEALVQMDSIASASRAILAIDSCGPSDPLGAAMGPFMHAHFFAGRQLAKSCLSSEHPQDVEERYVGPSASQILNNAVDYHHVSFLSMQQKVRKL